MIKLKKFVLNPFEENTFVLSDETNECVIVDPGCYTSDEEKELESYIAGEKLKPVMLINTHGHVDHILGNAIIVEKFGIQVYAHPEDDFLFKNASQHAIIFGLNIKEPPPINHYLKDNQVLKFGKSNLQVIHLPGHSPGGIALYSADDGFAIVGDVLFNGSIGRTDLPRGNYDILINSIKNKLLKLPADTNVFPGHGPSTTLGEEHDTNPFLIS